jgi:branched-chain amino acid transport system permease protein
MGTGIGFRAFAVAVVGGLESPLGILWVGLAYGVFEAVITGYINTGVRDIASFGVMILALAMRPQGLFGRTIVERA